MPWSDPEVRRQYHKQYYEKNKRKWPERYNVKTPEQRRIAIEKGRGYQLKRNYGISVEEYSRMLVAQGGVCAICRTAKKTGRGGLHVDHCHKTGRVRKLLCVRCNMALGVFEKHADKLAQYLKDNSQ